MEILGHDSAKAQLKKFIESKRVPPAFVFHGAAGTGKASVARWFALALNCSAPGADFEPCGSCPPCRAVASGTHMDFVFADFAYQALLTGKEIEKQQHISVETVREICAKSQQKAVMGGWKVLVVDHAETMTREAANALLKFMEEPPPRTVWILISAKKSAMLPTILSRSQAVFFPALSESVLKTILQDKGVDLRALPYAQGSVAQALKAAKVLEDFAGADSSAPELPFVLSQNLSRTLAEARGEVNTILDMLFISMHKKWEGLDDKAKEDFALDLKKIGFYKRAVGRNVSPALVLETALSYYGKYLDL